MQHGSRSISSHRDAGDNRTKRKMCQYPSLPLDEWPAGGFEVSCPGPGSHMPSWVKGKRPGTVLRQPALNSEGGCICKKPLCVPKRQNRKSSVQLHLSGRFPDAPGSTLQQSRSSLQTEQLLRGCVSAACVIKLYMSIGLALLFVFEGKPHHCCYVGWPWPRLFCKWSYIPSYLSLTDVFPCFLWKDTDGPLSGWPTFPFLSCSSSDLYKSQDMIPLRIHFI